MEGMRKFSLFEPLSISNAVLFKDFYSPPMTLMTTIKFVIISTKFQYKSQLNKCVEFMRFDYLE